MEHDWQERIERKLNFLLERVDAMSEDIDQLNQAVTDVAEAEAEAIQEIADELAEIQAGQPAPDFTPQVTSLEASAKALRDSVANAKTQLGSGTVLTPPTPVSSSAPVSTAPAKT